ncbi:MAG: TrmB family transcriptional regulator [Nitrososphaerales archaeon]
MQTSEVPSNESRLSALASLGLSQYESKCFLASLQTGPSTINQIGIVAGVPRTKVYGAVRKLVERGLLEQSEDNAKIFFARSPKDVLIPLLEKEQKRIKQGLEALAELEVIHQSMGYVKRAEALRSKVLRYYPRAALTRKLKELFESAKKKVVVLTTASGLVRLSKMAGILYERSKLGLTVEIFSSTLDEPVFATAVQSLKEIDNCVVEFLPALVSVQVVIVDSTIMFITELKPDDMRDDGMDVGFLIVNSEMSEIMEGLVRFLPSIHRDLPADAFVK